MVLDPSLIEHVDITAGLHPEGWILINAPHPPQAFSFHRNWHVASVDATSIAAKYRIGTQTQPIVNTTMVGAFARVTGIVGLEEITRAIAETIPSRVESNQNATREAYEGVVMSVPSETHARSIS
jgi:2-oxoacid:acceptor oxidoreductase gamma subunit (pyruvate/2-ketoisovalerate family)